MGINVFPGLFPQHILATALNLTAQQEVSADDGRGGNGQIRIFLRKYLLTARWNEDKHMPTVSNQLQRLNFY